MLFNGSPGSLFDTRRVGSISHVFHSNTRTHVEGLVKKSGTMHRTKRRTSTQSLIRLMKPTKTDRSPDKFVICMSQLVGPPHRANLETISNSTDIVESRLLVR